MLRRAVTTSLKIVLTVAVLAGAGVGVWYCTRDNSAAKQIEKLQQQQAKLEEQKKELETVVQRLEADRRVAEVLVTDQKTGGDGVLRTTLLFVEYAKDGSSLPPRSFTIEGNSAHVDAMVIKFEHDYIARNDPLRGHSIALFNRLFGDKQKPEEAFRIDEPGRVPDIYRGAAKQQSAELARFESNLWNNFWRLADDKEYRVSQGVRVASGQGVWGPFAPDRLYTLTLDADGGLNLTSEPLKGIYREAMKQRLTSMSP
jgi:hypothetical protein